MDEEDVNRILRNVMDQDPILFSFWVKKNFCDNCDMYKMALGRLEE